MVREALRLEREAAARYFEHPAASSDPRLVTYWESLRRNEAEHRRLLEQWLRAHGEDPDADAPLYGHFAYRAADPELVELFKELARGEAGHRNGLRRTIRTVEDPATPVILFCPLCGWAIDLGPDPAEGAKAKCPMCPGRFALRLDDRGDWTLERLAP